MPKEAVASSAEFLAFKLIVAAARLRKHRWGLVELPEVTCFQVQTKRVFLP